MASIEIENLKNIKKLVFDVPTSGVHLLTGINGCGKTTLLACLERLSNSTAFPRNFKTSRANQFDSYQSSLIKYSHDGQSVTYQYRNTRWAPRPKKNAEVLKTFGFDEVIFIGSTGERFYVQDEELNTQNISSVSQFFKDSMNSIFETTRFNDLRRVKLIGKGRGDGRWNYGFIIPTSSVNGQNQYFTERNFSLGEILILNALFALHTVKNNSLILIDEIELALHPKVQVKFLEFLKLISQQKNLTVIISTHSSSLIKSAPKLIHLERQSNGEISVSYDCFPALVLQNIAIEEEIQPDFVFFVEDKIAKNLLNEMLEFYFRNIYQNRRPVIKVMPVAGWKETIKFTIDSFGYLTPKNTKSYAFLDLDAQTEIQNIQNNSGRSANESELLNNYNLNIRHIKFLPITPELGIVDFIEQNNLNLIAEMQCFFGNATFDISHIVNDERNCNLNYSNKPRKNAKKKFDYYVARIKASTNKDISQTQSMIIGFYVSKYYSGNHGELQSLFNPLFR